MSRSKLGSSAVHLRLIGLIVTLVGATFACGGKSGSAHPLVWTDCGSGFGCATLDVPIDYDHPGGKSITLALTRLPASNPAQRIGVLLVNPGGPGKSGINLAHSAATDFPASVRSRFDVIGWDPRGVGQSSPVRCDDAARHLRIQSRLHQPRVRRATRRSKRLSLSARHACVPPVRNSASSIRRAARETWSKFASPYTRT